MNAVPIIIRSSSRIIQEAALRSSAHMGMGMVNAGLGKTLSFSPAMLPTDFILSTGSLKALQGTMIRIAHYIAANKFIFISGGIAIGCIATGTAIWCSLTVKQKQDIKNAVNIFITKIQNSISSILNEAVNYVITPAMISVKKLFSIINNFFKYFRSTPAIMNPIPGVDSVVQGIVRENGEVANGPETITESNEVIVGDDKVDGEISNGLCTDDNVDAYATPQTPPSGIIPVDIEYHPTGINSVYLSSVESYVSFALYSEDENRDIYISNIVSSSINILNQSISVLLTPPSNEIYSELLKRTIDMQIITFLSQFGVQ